MGQTDLDKKANEQDINKSTWPQEGHDRVNDVAEDDLLPVKGMPMKQTPKPFTIKGA